MSGFQAAPGKDFTRGDEPEIAKRLGELANKLGITIVGISGYRTPSQSVAVGGFADDPHTKGLAADIGVNGQLRASAGALTDAQLASVGLYRPFPGAAEINHVQLLPGSQQAMNNAKAPDDGVDLGQAATTGLGEAAKVAGATLTGSGGVVTAAATGLINDPVSNAVQSAVNATLGKLWDQVDAKAEYAGLFVLLVLAGVGLAAFGLLRATGRAHKPQETPA